MTDQARSTIDVLKTAKIIVIKIGSALVRGDELDQVNQDWLDALAQDVKALTDQGKKIIIVSSGGIALGRKALGISAKTAPNKIPLEKKQAASAVGQFHVFNGYHNAFKKLDIITAQVLLTMSDTEDRRMNLNARETLYTLLERNIIPVINENDTVSTVEIRFGDNDRLSVRVAQMVMADAVVLLSTIDGLYTSDPQKDPQAEHIPVIEHISDDHIKMGGDALAGLSTGGMKSKITAAISATKSGIHLVITDGRPIHAFRDLCSEPQKPSSLFISQYCDLTAREKWLGAHMRPKGIITIDDGALEALHKGKSLLPIGVQKVEGDFHRGDPIEIRNIKGQKVAMGISAYGKEDAVRIKGKHSREIIEILGFTGRDVLVHRNDMVLEL
ncbi:MAG: glutamate 5-kinase [Alphaproteobacteria bacterium]|nr:glutamate 5-kinase [Alphaproteobacteria bacterium]